MKQTSESSTTFTQANTPVAPWVETLTSWLDSKFTIPGTNFRFGIDPILGLLPGVGDAASLALSSSMLYHMARNGASQKLIILMLLNVVLDTIIGSIPILGNIIDFFYKPNKRNLKLFREHYQEGKHQGSGRGILILLIIGVVVVLGLIILMFIAFFRFIFSQL